MQATFTKSDFYNIKESALKARDNQALLHQYSVIAETENGIRELVIARLYASLRPGANRVTCILWTNGGHNANARRFDVKTWFFNVDENCKQADAYTFCQELLNKIERYAEDFGNDACHKLLKRLEAEYEYQTSDEAVKDTILANEYQFDFETAEMI